MKKINQWASEVVGLATVGGGLLGEAAYEERHNVFANTGHVGYILAGVALAETIVLGFAVHNVLETLLSKQEDN